MSIPFQQQQPVFGRVANIAELVRMTPEELNKYNISIDSYRTHLAIMKNERAEGIAEGMTKGAMTEKVATIKRLKALGLDNATITAATDLTTNEVARLLESGSEP